MPDTQLHIAILRCAIGLEELDTPAAVLDHLHKTLFQELQLSVLAAARFPLKWGDWKTVEKGKSVFIHRSVPRGWWDEYAVMARRDPDPGLIMARMSLAPFTWTESRQMLEPLGVDRWSHELALKHGMRDGFTCLQRAAAHAARAERPAPAVHRQAHGRDRQTSRPRRGDRAQSSKEGAAQARCLRPDPCGRGRDAAAVDTVGGRAMDYALAISLAMYCLYVFIIRSRSPRREGWAAAIIPLLVAIIFYTALKYAFIETGIQPR
jgi:hypothetical protein